MTQTKSPDVDMAATPGLIFRGNGVGAPVWRQIHHLRYLQENLYKPLTSVRRIIPRFSPRVKRSGSISPRFLAPKPFGGRTRLSVNQGTRKQNRALAHEMGPVQPCPSEPNGTSDRGAEYLATNKGKGCSYV